MLLPAVCCTAKGRISCAVLLCLRARFARSLDVALSSWALRLVLWMSVAMSAVVGGRVGASCALEAPRLQDDPLEVGTNPVT